MKKINDNLFKLIILLIIVFTAAINANYIIKPKVDTSRFVKLQHYIDDNKKDKSKMTILKDEIGNEYLKTIISDDVTYDKKSLKINGAYFVDGIKIYQDDIKVMVTLQDYYKPEVFKGSTNFEDVRSTNNAQFLITLNNTSQVIQNHELVNGNLSDTAKFQGLNLEGTLINGDIRAQEALDWGFNNASSTVCILINEYNYLDPSSCQQDYNGATIIGYTSSYRLVFLDMLQQTNVNDIVTLLKENDVKTAAIINEGVSGMSVNDEVLVTDSQTSDTYYLLRSAE